jgi:hypothetical protein
MVHHCSQKHKCDTSATQQLSTGWVQHTHGGAYDGSVSTLKPCTTLQLPPGQHYINTTQVPTNLQQPTRNNPCVHPVHDLKHTENLRYKNNLPHGHSIKRPRLPQMLQLCMQLLQLALEHNNACTLFCQQPATWPVTCACC